MSLFFTNKSYYLNITIYLERDIASSYIHEFVIDLNKLQNILKTEILLDVVHTRRQKPVELTWECTEYENSMWWAQ